MRRFAVLDLRGKNRVSAQAIIDARHRVTALEVAATQRRAAFLAPILPATAMHPDDQRQRPGGLFRQIEIELLPLVAGGDVGEIAMRFHAFRKRARRAFCAGQRSDAEDEKKMRARVGAKLLAIIPASTAVSVAAVARRRLPTPYATWRRASIGFIAAARRAG